MHHGELRCWGREDKEGLLGDWSLCWRVCGGPKEVGVCSRLGAVRERGYSEDRAVLSPGREKQSRQSPEVRQEGVLLLTWGWLSPPLLGVNDEGVFAFCSFPHHPKDVLHLTLMFWEVMYVWGGGTAGQEQGGPAASCRPTMLLPVFPLFFKSCSPQQTGQEGKVLPQISEE